MSKISVRVYGILLDDEQNVLISDEQEYGMRFTKFPGGGLEYGEGLVEGLKREYVEECAMQIEVLRHFYTTDFFVKSAFADAQILSVYYLIKNTTPFCMPVKTTPFDFDGHTEPLQAFRWVPVAQLTEEDMTFPIDKHVVALLKTEL